jgi:glycosyltransferase involved in cell wall biosynthesis
MACGTPVVGLRRGAVPEVVEEGMTGFVRDDVNGLVEAASHVDRIERPKCRCRVETMYSADVITEQYLEVYASRNAARTQKAS